MATPLQYTLSFQLNCAKRDNAIVLYTGCPERKAVQKQRLYNDRAVLLSFLPHTTKLFVGPTGLDVTSFHQHVQGLHVSGTTDHLTKEMQLDRCERPEIAARFAIIVIV